MPTGCATWIGWIHSWKHGVWQTPSKLLLPAGNTHACFEARESMKPGEAPNFTVFFIDPRCIQCCSQCPVTCAWTSSSSFASRLSAPPWSTCKTQCRMQHAQSHCCPNNVPSKDFWLHGNLDLQTKMAHQKCYMIWQHAACQNNCGPACKIASTYRHGIFMCWMWTRRFHIQSSGLAEAKAQ